MDTMAEPDPTRIGPYRITGTLGRGGMGTVYEAWDERLDRRVAIKYVRPEKTGSARARTRFRREARAIAGLNHPAIVQIFDLLDTDRGEAIVLELWAPNRRPIQVTTDLAGFWTRHYPELRRQLSRRYPKHHWPEDPLRAPPIALKRNLT